MVIVNKIVIDTMECERCAERLTMETVVLWEQ